MLTFPVQEKILGAILKNPSNKFCADCTTIAPTWASLDFGVFLCSNCSGAHRALGPTITRVKSVKLDLWKKEWVENMKIGNQELNKHWESQLTPLNNKPVMGASQNQVNRYVYDKYMKKRFMKDQNAVDPLTAYKNGTYQPQPEPVVKTKPEPAKLVKKATEQTPKPQVLQQLQPQNSPKAQQRPEVAKSTPAKDHNLLDFDFCEEKPKVDTEKPSKGLNQFEEDSQASQAGTSFTAETSNFTFDSLIKQSTPQQSHQSHHSHSLNHYGMQHNQNNNHNHHGPPSPHIPVNIPVHGNYNSGNNMHVVNNNYNLNIYGSVGLTPPVQPQPQSQQVPQPQQLNPFTNFGATQNAPPMISLQVDLKSKSATKNNNKQEVCWTEQWK